MIRQLGHKTAWPGCLFCYKKILAKYPMGVYSNYVDNKYILHKEFRWEFAMACKKCEEMAVTGGRTKKREEKEYKDLINRLRRIEGQVRGLEGMLEKDAYCADILTQVAATKSALNSFTKVLLSSHIKTCVTEDIRDGKEESVDEFVELLQKLMK